MGSELEPFNSLIFNHLKEIYERYTLISKETPYYDRIIEYGVTPISKNTYYNINNGKLYSREKLTSEEKIIIDNRNNEIVKVIELKKIPTFQIVKDEYEELKNLDTTNYIRFQNGILNTKTGTFEDELFPELKNIKMKTINTNYKENSEKLEELWAIFSKNYKNIYQFQLMLSSSIPPPVTFFMGASVF